MQEFLRTKLRGLEFKAKLIREKGLLLGAEWVFPPRNAHKGTIRIGVQMDHPEALHLTDKHPHCYVHYPRPILYPLPHNCLRAPLCNVPYPSPCTCDPVPKDLCSSNITFFFTVRSKSHHLTCSSMTITQQQPMECCPLIQPGRRGEGRHGMLLTRLL